MCPQPRGLTGVTDAERLAPGEGEGEGAQPGSSQEVAHVLQRVGLPLPDPAGGVVEPFLMPWLQRYADGRKFLLGLAEIIDNRPGFWPPCDISLGCVSP